MLDYFEMLSGKSIFVEGVGHIHSPKLKDLLSSNFMDLKIYNFYLNLLYWDKTALLKYGELLGNANTKKLYNEKITAFDVIALLKEIREHYQIMFSFFIDEDVFWSNEDRCFVLRPVDKDLNQEDTQNSFFGTINKGNFEDIRKKILNLNFVGLDEDDKEPVSFSSQKAKDNWERIQDYLKKQAEQTKSNQNDILNNKQFHLCNIISKICAMHPSYNLLNIYDLTIFQLYDTFYQLSYLKGFDLSERIFSHYGGKDFKPEGWLNPILKNI